MASVLTGIVVGVDWTYISIEGTGDAARADNHLAFAAPVEVRTVSLSTDSAQAGRTLEIDHSLDASEDQEKRRVLVAGTAGNPNCVSSTDLFTCQALRTAAARSGPAAGGRIQAETTNLAVGDTWCLAVECRTPPGG